MAAPTRSAPSFRGLVVLLAGEGTTRLLSFLAVSHVARQLGDRGWAPVGVALAVLGFAALAVELGFPLLGAREVARDRTAVARLVPRIVPLQLLVALVLAVLAFVVARAAALDPELAELLPGYAASLLLLPLALPWIFQGRGEMAWVTAPQVVRQAVFLAIVVLFVHGVEDRAIVPRAEIAAVASAAIVALLAFRRREPLRTLKPASPDPRLLREALPIGGSQLLWSLRMFLPTLLLWNLVAKESVGRYDAAHKVMMVLQALLTMYFTNLFPTLARAVQGPRPELDRLIARSTALAAGGTALVALGIAAAAKPLIALVFGPGFALDETARCLAALVFVIPVLALRGHARMTLLALGRARTELQVSIAGTVLLAALVVTWAPARGAVGAAWALLAAEGVATALTWIVLRRTLKAPDLRPAEPAEPAA